ncbi:MAG: hypothetical protein ACLTUL_20535 [Blautia faecis]
MSGIPYSIAQIQKLVHEREQSEDAKAEEISTGSIRPEKRI